MAGTITDNHELKYNKRLDEIYKTVETGNLILSTGDFQCPNSGWGCIFKWNVDKDLMWAEICDLGCWNLDEIDEDIAEDTYQWCNQVGKNYVYSAEEANNILYQWLESEAQFYYFEEDDE